MIQDPKTGKLIGDTFEIALYLDATYPDRPSLFHPLTAGLTAAWNAHVDGIFTSNVMLIDKMPFDPSVQKEVDAIFAKRAGVRSLDDFKLSVEQREQMFVAFEAALGDLAKAWQHTGGTTDYCWAQGGKQTQQPPPGREQGGAFLDGDEPAYADFIVGAWLKMLEASMKPEDWQRVRGWQGGLWGRLVDALSKWSEIK